MHVIQPSPGLMVGGQEDDVLATWKDCYLMQPKRRLVEDAKSEIQQAWAMWDGDKTTDDSMLVFFRGLSRYRPYFLTFLSRKDLWRKVHGWLVEYEREKKARC